MYSVDQPGASANFVAAWKAALGHLDALGGGRLRWLRAHLDQPFAEHLSFLFGNQLFFIYVPAAEYANTPTEEVFLKLSGKANAIPCLLSMECSADNWSPANGGWGLVHAVSGETVDPPGLVSEELVAMTDWEVHNVGIQVVAQHLVNENCSLISRQPDPDIHPQLWFDDNGHSFWALVSTTRDPAAISRIEDDLRARAQTFTQQLGSRGFFGAVLVVASDAMSDETGEWSNITPLFRGHPLQVSFDGLKPVFPLN